MRFANFVHVHEVTAMALTNLKTKLESMSDEDLKALNFTKIGGNQSGCILQNIKYAIIPNCTTENV